jgi:ESS family glutamate:Na+ symporter
MIAVQVFCLLSLLLLVGKLLRVGIPLLQKLYLPSSVIGGVAGLVVIQLFPGLVDRELIGIAGRIPGFLINVIFATLFLGMATPKVGEMLKLAFPQLCFGQILAWGQYVLGLGITGFVLAPLFGVPPAFGNLLEIGFQGGHGTVGGMTSVFESFDWRAGIALGYTVATAGMIIAVIVGMALINWATRKGDIVCAERRSNSDEFHQRGIYRPGEQPAAGRQTVLCDSIDSLGWHCALAGLAIGIGYLGLRGLQIGESYCLPDAKVKIFSGFPLFPLCMVAGLLIQLFARKARVDALIDRGQMQRIAGASLDFLVVAAVATIRIEVVLRNWLPLTILILSGTLLSVLMVIFVAPKLFRTGWFERAISDFGQSLGVTATGLLLLRTVDPENRSGAAESFGCKQLLHEPFMGGGICTALALTLVFTIGWFKVFIGSLVLLLVWSLFAALLIVGNRRARRM